MKGFFKDYKDDIIKPQVRFMKKHWLGTTVLCLLGGLLPLAYYEHKYELFGIKDKVKQIFKKKETKEEEA